MPVLLSKGDDLFVLRGTEAIERARQNGQGVIECNVLKNVDAESEATYRICDEYYSSLLPPIKMAEAFLSYRGRNCLTLQEASRRTGITAGTIRHYESLVNDLAPDLQEKLANGQAELQTGTGR